MRKIYALLPFLLITLFSRAQDIHFTQYNLAPVALNPAYTGAFYGTFRVGAIYRTQWFNVDGFNSFKTPDIYIDAPIIKGFRDNHWVGVGANLYQDEAGALELTFGSFLGSAAYHLGLNKDMSSVITLGVQGGMVSRSLANSMAKRLQVDETLPSDMDNSSYFDLNAGVLFRTPLGRMALLEAGVAAFHLTSPDYALQQGRQNQLPMRLDVHARVKTYLNEAFSITPSVLYKNQNKTDELSLQVLAGAEIDRERKIDVNAGLGYRVNELAALEILFGIDWGNFKAGFGYDIAMGSNTGSGPAPGAVEFAASYIARIYKKPDPKPSLFCPRF